MPLPERSDIQSETDSENRLKGVTFRVKLTVNIVTKKIIVK